MSVTSERKLSILTVYRKFCLQIKLPNENLFKLFDWLPFGYASVLIHHVFCWCFKPGQTCKWTDGGGVSSFRLITVLLKRQRHFEARHGGLQQQRSHIPGVPGPGALSDFSQPPGNQRHVSDHPSAASMPEEKAVELRLAGERARPGSVAGGGRVSCPGHQHRRDHRHDAARQR